MVVICCYFEKKKDKVFKLQMNNFSYSEIPVPQLKASKLNKCQGSQLEEIKY